MDELLDELLDELIDFIYYQKDIDESIDGYSPSLKYDFAINLVESFREEVERDNE